MKDSHNSPEKFFNQFCYELFLKKAKKKKILKSTTILVTNKLHNSVKIGYCLPTLLFLLNYDTFWFIATGYIAKIFCMF